MKQLANGATNASIVYHVFFRSFNDIYHSDRVPIKRYHWWKFISSPRHNLSEHTDENLWLNADDKVFVNTSDNLDGKNKVSAINNETKKLSYRKNIRLNRKFFISFNLFILQVFSELIHQPKFENLCWITPEPKRNT